MKVVTLMENEAAAGYRCAFGLSLYVETEHHRILLDAGPDTGFAENAKKLGVELAAVDTAILSHGHSDHSDGLAEFLKLNPTAPVYIQDSAWGGFYAQTPDGTNYIGISPEVEKLRGRFVPLAGERKIDEELYLFQVPGEFPKADTSARLKEKKDGLLTPDVFGHEQDLLITSEGKAVVLSGCAHRGIVGIVRRAGEILGRAPDAVVGGFHLKDLEPGASATGKLLETIGGVLSQGNTVYYTGHCTGDYAYETLSGILGERLRPIRAGSVIEL